jgi:hypothetical protein
MDLVKKIVRIRNTAVEAYFESHFAFIRDPPQPALLSFSKHKINDKFDIFIF